MKNWVHISFIYKDEWIIFAQKAFDFVDNEAKNKK
jgi:hypothetical protein